MSSVTREKQEEGAAPFMVAAAGVELMEMGRESTAAAGSRLPIAFTDISAHMVYDYDPKMWKIGEEERVEMAVAPIEEVVAEETQGRDDICRKRAFAGVGVFMIVVIIGLILLVKPEHCKPTDSAAVCGVPPYQRLFRPASCDELQHIGHTNSYWKNDKFLCRLNTRPCNT